MFPCDLVQFDIPPGGPSYAFPGLKQAMKKKQIRREQFLALAIECHNPILNPIEQGLESRG